MYMTGLESYRGVQMWNTDSRHTWYRMYSAIGKYTVIEAKLVALGELYKKEHKYIYLVCTTWKKLP